MINNHMPLRPLPSAASAAGTQQAAAVTTVSPQATHQRQIAEFLRNHVFHELPEPAREELVRTRSERLAEKGKTAANVMDVMAKGKKADEHSAMLVGGIRSLPFTVAGAMLTALPQITTLNGQDTRVNTQNILGAALFVAANSVLGTMLQRSTSDTGWLTSEGKQLEAPLAELAESRKASNLQKGVASAVAVQSFTGKNIGASLMSAGVKGAVKAAGNEDPAKVGATFKGSISSGGSAAAGAMMSLMQLVWDKKKGRNGPEYLLGSQNWEQQFDSLEAYDFKQRASNVFSRALHLPLDVAQDFSKSVQSLFTPTGIVSDLLVLGGGIAANESLRTTAKNAALASGLTDIQAALAGDLAAAGGEMAYFGAWALTAAVTPDVAAFADKMINKLRSRGALEEGDMAEAQRLLENPANRVSDSNQPNMHGQMTQQASVATATDLAPSSSGARTRTSLTRAELNV